MTATIGIKIANGEFYSILAENSQVKKRLVLTTVHNNQKSVQIDLYKSSVKSMFDALYIGSLVVENIKPLPKGEPSIELTIVSTPDGNINAEAFYLDGPVNGEHQSLTVSLRSLEEDNREYADFELEQGEPPPRGLYEKASVVREEEKKPFPWLILVCGILVITAILLALWLFFFRSPQPAPGRPAQQPVQQEQITQPQAVQQEPPAPPPPLPPPAPPPVAQHPPVVQPPPPVIQAPVTPPPAPPPAAVRRTRPVPPVASYNVPSVIPREGVVYRIRWGDTLWDIAEAFYRDPWQYPRIARFNNIRNPDLIISGTTIRVPPRN